MTEMEQNPEIEDPIDCEPENTAEELDVEVVEETEAEPEIVMTNSALEAEKEKYLRLYAEFDNYRKRTTREKADTRQMAMSDCIAEMLPVIDSLSRALEMTCADEAFYNGIALTYTKMLETLKKMGVTEITSVGSEFDPNLHNAIRQVEDTDYADGIVCEEFQKGFQIGDRVIRHSIVAVANS